MNKIDTRLEIQMSLHPGDTFDVIITLMEGTDMQAMGLPEHRVLMHNIVAASLKADQLCALSKMEYVLAVEPDGPVGIM